MAFDAVSCVFNGTGIILSLLVYGLLQERIMQTPYDYDIFSHTAFIVFCNRISYIAFGVLLTLVKGESFENHAPLWKYFIISLSNLIASYSQYEALKYVSFTVQMLGKSCKVLPVMLWGSLFFEENYHLVDWLIGAALTSGVAEFSLTGSVASRTNQNNSYFGFVLLVMHLTFDGLTSRLQEKLFKDHTTSKYNQLLYINLYSAGISLGCLLLSNTLTTALAFCGAHPALLADIAVLGSSSTVSQYFIYSQVQDCGALVLATTMNIRQIISITASHVRYGNTIARMQLFGLAVVFCALFGKLYLRRAAKSTETRPILQETEDVESARRD